MKPFSLLLVIVIAAMASGCAPKTVYVSSGCGFDFDLDGVEYSCLGVCSETNTSNTKVVFRDAVILVYPENQKREYRPGLRSDLDKSKSPFASVEIVESHKEITVSLNSVVFVDNNKIVFDKSFKELGIDIADPDALSEENLLPILEKLIRENVARRKTRSRKECRDYNLKRRFPRKG